MTAPTAIVRGHKCQNSYCMTCGHGWGYRVRLRMVEGLTKFTTYRPIMLTLTVDPERFEHPQDAVDWVHRGSRIAKTLHMMKKAGHVHGGRFVWVLEFHRSGWPHWHVAVDSAFVPHGDLQAEWDRRGREGRMGHVWCGKKRFGNRLHAALYMSKYMTKYPEHGWPEWVTESKDVYRRFGASKGLLPRVTPAAEEPESDEEMERLILAKLEAYFEKKCRKHWEELQSIAGLGWDDPRKSLAERLEACGQSATVFSSASFGEKFAGVLKLPVKVICDLVGVDHRVRPIKITWRQCEWLFSPEFGKIIDKFDPKNGVYI